MDADPRLRGSNLHAETQGKDDLIPTSTSREQKNVGGRPKIHDWEQFWIEVALYGALQTLDIEHGEELRKHMMDWSASNMDPAPDVSTIRARLTKLRDQQKKGARSREQGQARVSAKRPA